MSTDDLTEALRIAGQARGFTDPSSRERALVVLADEVDELRAELTLTERQIHDPGGYFERVTQLEAERDAARAALERVRAIHASRPFDYARDLVTFGQETFPDRCTGCRGADYPCQTIRALEGKP